MYYTDFTPGNLLQGGRECPMLRYDAIRKVEINLTNKCNAACLQCPRNVDGGVVLPGLALSELTLCDIRALFPGAFLAHLEEIHMCGNFGDAMVARDILEIFQYMRRANSKLFLHLSTNGSGRDAAWWSRLARILARDGVVEFHIDGLEDTNHLYRRHTRWSAIMNAVSSFIGAGGRARWTFIPFRHNEHQVEEAAELAGKLGFEKFSLKKTRRFSAGKHQEFDGFILAPPERQDLRGSAIKKSQDADFEDKAGAVEIDCAAVNARSIFISAESHVFPCCWLAAESQHFRQRSAEFKRRQFRDLIGRVGFDAINGKLNSVERIVEGPFFQHFVPDSWRKPCLSEGKLLVCAEKCGLKMRNDQEDVWEKARAAS